MKKIFLASFLLLLTVSVRAENMIVSTLLDHVTTSTQLRSGETKITLLDSVVRIGSTGGKSLVDLQAGFSSETAPEAGDPSGANLLAGAYFKVSSLLSSKINLPLHWEFLRSLEHGPSVNYDFREKAWYGCYQIGLAFSLNPK